MKGIGTLIMLLLLSFSGKDPNPLDEIMLNRPGLHKIHDQPLRYMTQIIYTQIDRDKFNNPFFKQYTYQLDAKKYFYAASLVKLPCSALALERLEEMKVPRNATMYTDSICNCQKRVKKDTSSATGLPSMENYIKRMLLISDNDAYSRTFELLGQEYIYKKMNEKGYLNTFIIHRFDAGCSTRDNSCTNAIDFYDESGTLIHKKLYERFKGTIPNPLGEVKVGKGYMDAKNKLVMEPKDFSNSNFISLQDINDMLKSIVFPKSVVPSFRFNISEDNRKFMLKYLSMLPRESDRPRYNTKEFYDSYKKYLIYGDSKKKITGDSIRIFNIVGQSYGYMSDVAYVVDFKNNIEFMLSAVIYTNDDGIINDGKYEYDKTALPFFGELGRAIYAFERKRKKENAPDLDEFKFVY